ncbi:MAG: hypothetical protein K940chlam2_01551, partial [Chlamydiae bacterium]|nr:hypothetical protein [Chlamydiota bacterium]
VYNMKFRNALIALCLSLFSMGHAAQQEYYSQASQDEFVYTLLYTLLDKQDAGSYLEIGAGDPVTINNSYFFERSLGWRGVSIDIVDRAQALWSSVRSNLLLIEDATESDYAAILESFPKSMDYLSLDIDGAYDVVLRRIPFDEHTFKVITIEHDVYRFGKYYRTEERKILTSLGYHLLCGDVSCQGLTFEDWWIHPSAFSPEIFSRLSSLDLDGKDHKQIIEVLQIER